MDGKITKEGKLAIKRGSKYKKQECIKYPQYSCCDECQLFGEPYDIVSYSVYNPPYKSPSVGLKLCDKQRLEFIEFTDERE